MPDIRNISPTADNSKMPRYFAPRRVDDFTEGTLNFCMLTHWPRDMTDKISIHIDDNDIMVSNKL